jgi:hypothetical protein
MKKKHKAIIVMNSQHSLMDSQVDILQGKFDDYSVYPVPPQGWTMDQMDDHIQKIQKQISQLDAYMSVIFVSPIPHMMIRLQDMAISADGGVADGGLAMPTIVYDYGVGAFQAPLRKKVQKGDSIFYTVPKKGWTLVGVGLDQH